MTVGKALMASGRSVCLVQQARTIAVHFRLLHIVKTNGIDRKSERHWEEVQIPVPWGHVSGKWWGSRDKQPVLAMHGWQDNAGSFDRLIPLLPSDIPILAIDLPGHGLSSHYPKGFQYYLGWNGMVLVRRIVNHFKWEKFTMLGHSLGGMIGFLYAAAFPDEVEKLISIEVVGPTLKKLPKSMESVRLTVEALLEYEQRRPDLIPSYGYHEMMDMVLDAFQGSITRESCAALMKRGIKPSPTGSGYVFTRDIRLKANGVELFSWDQVLAIAHEVKCKYMNIRGNPGTDRDVPEYYEAIIEKLKDHTYVEYHVIEGTHHLHLNTPEKISEIISRFLLDSTGDVA